MVFHGPGPGENYICEVCGYEWVSRTKFQDPAKCPRCHTELTFDESQKCTDEDIEFWRRKKRKYL